MNTTWRLVSLGNGLTAVCTHDLARIWQYITQPGYTASIAAEAIGRAMWAQQRERQ